jgi:hypothetical protein
MDSEHTSLLFHSEIRWLSRGTVLKKLFKLNHKVHLFLKNMTPLSSHFEDDLQENIIDMTTDRRFQTIFKEKSLRNSGVK